MAGGPPVFGRPSPAAESTPALRQTADAPGAAIRADGGDGDWCAIRAVSVAGVRHRLSGEPCQDSFAWACGRDVVAVAVADGLGAVSGSADAAARAAAAAVEAAVTAESHSTGSDPSGGPTVSMSALVDAGLEAANQAAEGGGATTLTLGLVSRDGQVALARVGDSSAFLVEGGGSRWVELFAVPDDDGVVNETAALPGQPLPEVASATLRSGDTMVLATDGVSDPWRDGPTTVAPALAAAVASQPRPLELAQLADFSRQGCHDDRTVVALWLLGPTPEPGTAAPSAPTPQ